MLYHFERQEVFQCVGCAEYISIPKRVRTNPEEFLIFKEHMTEEHKPCSSFSDASLAQAARKRARKERQREEQRHLRSQGLPQTALYIVPGAHHA